MSIHPLRSPHPTGGLRPRGERAIALVTVLAILVIISVMVVAFMSSIGTELSASKAHADSNAAQILADTAANIVMTQIRQATTETVDSTETGWASQPGMIRTYLPNGGLSKVYKLYSSGTMVASSISLNAEVTDMANWSTQPAIFTDLNQPVSGSYPITPPPDSTIDGYSLSSTPPGASTSQPIPMPARWLYILSDGSLVSPTVSGTGTRATILGSSTASIVGRIAFWTDDESSKININTASEGSYWDTPHFAVNDDVNLATYQPVNGEFQRYPGHPAGVSLSAVFPTLNADTIYGIVPRIQPGGSDNGTVSSTTAIIPDTDRLYSNTDELLFRSGTDGRLTQGFTQAQLVQSRFLLTARSSAPELNLFGRPRVSIWPVHVDFATNPNSPYTNAFDRLSAFCSTYGSISSSRRFYFQRQDSGSATNDYANIQRNRDLYSYLQNMTSRAVPGFSGVSFQDKYGSDADQILTEIFDYIRCTNLFDDSLGNSYVSGTAPTQFYQFTTPRKSTSYYWPGHGQVSPIQIGSTQGLGRYYTISEIGLHIICTADGNGLAPATNLSAYDPKAVSNLATARSLTGSNGTAVGTDYTAATATTSPFPYNPTLADTYGGSRTALNSGQKRLQAALLFEATSAMPGWTGIEGNFQISVSGLENLKINGLAPFPSTSSGTQTRIYDVYKSTVMGGVNGFRYTVGNSVNGWSNPTNTARYPFISNPFTVSTNTLSISTSGTISVSLLAVNSKTKATEVIQTFGVSFPDATGTNGAALVPTPDLILTGVNEANGKASNWWGYDTRVSRAVQNPGNGSVQYEGSFIRSNLQPAPASWRLSLTDTTTTVDPTSGDVLRTLMPKAGDLRLVAATHSVDTATLFQTHPAYSGTSKLAHSFQEAGGAWPVVGASGGYLVSGNATSSSAADVPGDVSSAAATGDWDNSLPGFLNGAFANKPDEGNNNNYKSAAVNPPGPSFFAPNRIIPSPGMFGSLPTQVKAGIPWQTLLFRPQQSHPANTKGPKDHLIMDLFNMPVVEPYALSEPLSTSGKINMNYQIMPYTYITRNTAVRAALKAEKIAAVPNINGGIKSSTGSFSPRHSLNLSDINGTLRQFRERFEGGDIFRSATEICDVYLVPDNQTWISNQNAETYWAANQLTGDNLREKPYTNLYARLTTKSNVFQVYYRVQTLQRPKNGTEVWDESMGAVTGERRGSVTIERYIDPTDATLPDCATNPTGENMEGHYRFRVINQTRFNH